jgi:hypothetical protein
VTGSIMRPFRISQSSLIPPHRIRPRPKSKSSSR